MVISRIVLMSYDLGERNINKLREEFPQFVFDVVEKNTTPNKQRLAQAEVVVGIADTAHIPALMSVRYIHTLSSGINSYLEAIKRLPQAVQVSNSAGVFGTSVSEHALSLLLATTHAIKKSVLNMQSGRWEKCSAIKNISGSTVGILGTGDIGSKLARALKAMGARTLGYKLHKSKPSAPFDALFYEREGLDELLSLSDFVVICLPGTSHTKGLIDAQRFSRFKDGAVLINVGRGFIVDTDAMTQALNSGKLTAAAVDVTEPEPLPPNHPLWRMQNVIITPHCAWRGVRKQQRADWFAKNMRAYVEGQPLPGAVDITYEY